MSSISYIPDARAPRGRGVCRRPRRKRVQGHAQGEVEARGGRSTPRTRVPIWGRSPLARSFASCSCVHVLRRAPHPAPSHDDSKIVRTFAPSHDDSKIVRIYTYFDDCLMNNTILETVLRHGGSARGAEPPSHDRWRIVRACTYLDENLTLLPSTIIRKSFVYIRTSTTAS